MKLPSDLSGIIHLPLDWTPEQARAVIEIMGLLEEEIWSLYGDDIMYLIKSQRTASPPRIVIPGVDQNSEDDIPF